MNHNKHILVCGGAGFIGSNLCRRLVADKGNMVTCVDNLSTGKLSNISDIVNNGNFSFVLDDISSAPLEISNMDEIYNFACPASPKYYQEHPIQTVMSSVVGVRNLCELAIKTGAAILHSSTSEVYGNSTEHPQKESYAGNVNILGPRACYDEGKRCAESILMDYHRKYNVNVKIIRIFNTYGPYMSENDGRVIPNFICQALNGDPITIHGDGKQTRSFQYIDDLLIAIERAMHCDLDFIGPVNIGNPEEYTIFELAKKILELTNSESQIKFVDRPKDDPQIRRPDICLAKKELLWEPKILLADGLMKTIEYFKNIKNL